MKLFSFFLIMLLIRLILSITSVQADSAYYPKDYTYYTDDGRYILVGIMPDSYINEGKTINPDIRKHYATSGLYPINDPLHPVWTSEYPGVSTGIDTIYSSLDGHYLIRFDNMLQRGITFFTDGKTSHSYAVEALIPNARERIQHSITYCTWLNSSHVEYKSNILNVNTLSGEKYVFDMRSGAIVYNSQVGFYELPLALENVYKIQNLTLTIQAANKVFVFKTENNTDRILGGIGTIVMLGLAMIVVLKRRARKSNDTRKS